MVLFFTIPPMMVKWPWVLVNQFNIDASPRTLTFSMNGSKLEIQTESYGWSYLLVHRQSIEFILLDSGVEKLFRRKNPFQDYPPQYEQLWVRNAERLIKLFGKDRVIITIPDYPDDYTHTWGYEHALWANGKDNIERTIENVVYYWDRYCRKLELKCLVPVQGYHDDPSSISKSIRLLHSYGILREVEYLAVANLCTTKRSSVIVEEARIARNLIGNDKWIHVFDPSVVAIGNLARYVDSVDTAVPFSRRKLWLAAYLGVEYRDVIRLRSLEVEKLMFAKVIERAVKKLDPGFVCGNDIDSCIERAVSVLRSVNRNTGNFVGLDRWIRNGK